MGDAEDKKIDELAQEASRFEAVEKEFQDVLQELSGDPALEKFRKEYEKLHRALRKSHESEKRLIKKCRELNNEVVQNTAKVQTALKLSEEDQSTINSLQAEVDKAWKVVEANREKEAQAKDTIQQLKLEISNLTRLVEQGAGLNLGPEETVEELLRQKEELIGERDAQVTQIVALRNEVMDLSERLRRAEADKLEIEGQLHTLKDTITSKKAEGEREQRKREKMEKDIVELRNQLDTRTVEIRNKQAAITQGEENVARLEGLLKEQRLATDRANKEFNLLNEKVTKLHKDLEEQIHTNTQLLAENSQKQMELKMKEDETQQVKLEAFRTQKLREATIAKLKAAEAAKADVERARDDLKGQVAALEHEIDQMRRQEEMEKKKQDDLVRERDILTKLKAQAENATVKQMDMVKMADGTRKTLEQEIAGYRAEAQRAERKISELERERDRTLVELQQATQQYVGALEEVKIRDATIGDLQRSIQEGEARLRQQQALYEAVRSDRNLYSKNLLEAQAEVAELKRRFKISTHQIEQLKEEIGAKDVGLVKEHFDHMKVQKEKDSLQLELTKAKLQIGEAESVIASQSSEIQKLNQIIAEADAERVRQRKEYDVVVADRDILGTQLVRRNDELQLLYEKIKIQQSTLSKGAVQYRECLSDIRLLKIKLAETKRELGLLRLGVANVDVLKREVHFLGRELLAERTKVKALSEELENPLNVHRWRKLEGSDPAAFEMIQRIQTLQKRLIVKTEEVAEKDLLIQEKEKLYVELKSILARQPGPEVAEQLHIYQQNLREKTRQMKAMASELNLYQAQTAEQKYELDRLHRELHELKHRYYAARKQARAEGAGGGAATWGGGGARGMPFAGQPGSQQFVGGGFKVDEPKGRREISA